MVPGYPRFRDAAQVVHGDDVMRLLDAHPDRLTVRYHLSRADDVPGVCATAPGATYAAGRPSEAAVRPLFADWPRTAASRFLVVGTGAMERAAWGWLAGLGFADRPLLRPTRWARLDS